MKKNVGFIIIPRALTIVACTSLGFVQNINESEKYNCFSTILKIVTGIAILFKILSP